MKKSLTGKIIKLRSDFYDRNGDIVNPHRYLVLSDKENTYKGESYNYLCLQLDKVKSTTRTFPDTYYFPTTQIGAERPTYISTSQILLFDDKTSFEVIGEVSPDRFKDIIQLQKTNPMKNKVNCRNLSSYRKKEYELHKKDYHKLTSDIDEEFYNLSNLTGGDLRRICKKNKITVDDYLKIIGYENNLTNYISDLKDEKNLASNINKLDSKTNDDDYDIDM